MGCLIFFAGPDSPASVALKAVAAEYYEKAGKNIDDMPYRFFYGPDGGVVSQIRNLTKVQGFKMILLDIPDNGGFYICDKDESQITVDVIKEFLSSGKGPRSQLNK